MNKITLLCAIFILFASSLFAADSAGDKKTPRIDDPEKKHKTDTKLTTEDVDDLKTSLNTLSLFFPNEIYIDSALTVNLRYYSTPEDEIESQVASFYSFSNSIGDSIEITYEDSEQIENSIDSIVNIWGVKEYVSKNNVDTISRPYDSMLTISDSVYIERLSKLPAIFQLSYNNVVRSFIELYSSRRKDKLSVILGLSEYYFPMFEQALDANDMPLELKYLPVIESALNPRARSRAGATGLWQFMHFTGKMYGLEINSLVDERSDPVKATNAAVKYLKDLYAIYNDWTLVIAAYNCGPGNVNKAIRRAGGQKDYWKIYNYLPRETRGYVPAFIGATYAMNYHEKHYIPIEKITIPVDVDTVMINERLNLQQVASVLEIPIEQLRDMNPQYRNDIIPETGKSYILTLPTEKTLSFIDLKDSIFTYKKEEYVNENIIAEIGSRKPYSKNIPSIKNKTKISYTVKQGDNPGFISAWYGVKTSDLCYWNNIYKNRIHTGKKLDIYVPTDKAEYYSKIDQLSFDDKQKLVGKSAPSNSTNYVVKNTETQTSTAGDYVYYRVRRGDNLWTIAKKYQGVSNIDIMKLNNLTSQQVQNLKPGDVLKIKKI